MSFVLLLLVLSLKEGPDVVSVPESNLQVLQEREDSAKMEIGR